MATKKKSSKSVKPVFPFNAMSNQMDRMIGDARKGKQPEIKTHRMPFAAAGQEMERMTGGRAQKKPAGKAKAGCGGQKITVHRMPFVAMGKEMDNMIDGKFKGSKKKSRK